MLQSLQAAAAECGSEDPPASRLCCADIHDAHRLQKLNQRDPYMDGDAESVDDFSDIHAALHRRQLSILRGLSRADNQLWLYLLDGERLLRRRFRRQLRCLHSSHHNQSDAEKITNS